MTEKRPEAQVDFDDALRTARVKQAIHLEARMEIRDAHALRLSALYQDVQEIVDRNPQAQTFVELALVDGSQARLWIDLVTYVVMAPDPRTYRLVQDTERGPETLLESTNRSELVERITELLANRVIERTRMLKTAAPAPEKRGYGVATVLLAWISGFSLGVLLLFVIGILIADGS